MIFDASWLMLAFFVAGQLLKLREIPSTCSHKSKRAQNPSILTKIPRPLKPRSADDCDLCCGAKSKPLKSVTEGPVVRPWPELKSRRGHPKQISTEGFACANVSCQYFGIKNE
jgi:hypothetical protein